MKLHADLRTQLAFLVAATWMASLPAAFASGDHPVITPGPGGGVVTDTSAEFMGLTAEEYQRVFDTFVKHGFRPTDLKGHASCGKAHYRLRLERTTGTAWVAKHGCADADFQRFNRTYAAQGYRLSIHSRFEVAEKVYHAALWER